MAFSRKRLVMGSTSKELPNFKILPPFLVLLFVFALPSLVVTWIIANGLTQPIEQRVVSSTLRYPRLGAELDSSTFAQELPPPPLDALPYDVREPLVNGDSVPVKKRWLWIPEGKKITVTGDQKGNQHVNIPLGSKWWKEFYMLTDRGTYLIERRIVERVQASDEHPNGWAYYSAHYMPTEIDLAETMVIPSVAEEAAAFNYQASDWLPTQVITRHFEVQFEDTRGVQYGYVFPGQANCVSCHQGATGAYPNETIDPVEVFGLHPQNLTPESFRALIERGWIVGGDALLVEEARTKAASEVKATVDSFDQVHGKLLAVIRNNCASCHNMSPNAAASYTAFVVDPNYNYSPEELMEVFSQQGKMFADAYALVTPGSLEQSEIYLRLTGSVGRRRMPPIEGGLSMPDAKMVNLFEQWIVQVNEQ